MDNSSCVGEIEPMLKLHGYFRSSAAYRCRIALNRWIVGETTKTAAPPVRSPATASAASPRTARKECPPMAPLHGKPDVRG